MRWRLLKGRLAACLVVLLGVAAGALAYFAAAPGSGVAATSVGTLSAPGTPAASGSGSNVNVSWTASTLNASIAATSYTVERYNSSGGDLGVASCGTVPASSGTPNAFGSFSCTDSPGSAGTYEYKITAHYHSSWTATSAFTNTVRVLTGTTTAVAAPASDATGTLIAPTSISATLSGATTPATGTITFIVFGPQASAPTSCSSGGTSVGTAAVAGNGAYHPLTGYTPATAGSYWWYASYGGDSNNSPSVSTCGAGMVSTVVKNATTTTASAPSTGTAGSAIAASSISSTLSGATTSPAAGGTISFTVFGPQATPPTACTSGGTQVGTATVSSNGTYHPSASFTPAGVGTYWWYAGYSGDTSDSGSASTCGAGMASTVVAKSSPTSTAAAPATGRTGSAIAASSISATLSGGASPTGTITLTVFGPQSTAPTVCTVGGTTVGTATVSGNGTYNPSAGYTPTIAGTYWWRAGYGGDANNNSSNSTCGTGMASTAITNATTTTVAAPATDTAGTAIAASSISSTLSGATTSPAAGGTITFTVFGPQASPPTSCASGGTQVGSAVTVSGNSTYHPSAGYTPATAGTYWWYASYSGDANDASSNSTCGTGMTSTVAWSGASAASATTTTKNSTSATTSSLTVQPSRSYLLFVFRHSASGDSISSISSSGLSPALTTSSFTSITSQNYNSSVDYQWAYYITTASNASGSGTLTVNFTSSLPTGGVTILDLVQIAGNDTSSPIVTVNEKATNGSGTTATANLPSAPGSQDASIVFLSGNASLGGSAPLGTPAMSNLFYSQQGAGSMDIDRAIPATQNETFTITNQPWGTIALELRHG